MPFAWYSRHICHILRVISITVTGGTNTDECVKGIAAALTADMTGGTNFCAGGIGHDSGIWPGCQMAAFVSANFGKVGYGMCQ